jgi:hypothetical protein
VKQGIQTSGPFQELRYSAVHGFGVSNIGG